jgi:hypothetical protein
MISGRQIPHPVEVFEAVFGTPVKVEFWLTRESETSFFANVFSANIILDASTKLAQFISLHPWFCQHVVFVWKENGKTSNVVIKSFKYTNLLYKSIGIMGIEVHPVSNLLACEIVEDARQAIETYDGTEASKLQETFTKKHYDEARG